MMTISYNYVNNLPICGFTGGANEGLMKDRLSGPEGIYK